MYKLGDRYIQADTPFEHNGIRYPANWLRLSSSEEKQAIGLVEIQYLEPIDRRFYKPLDANGIDIEVPIPRELSEVQDEQIQSINETMKIILTPTDWVIVKSLETGEPIPNNIKDFRASVRATGFKIKEKIKAAKDIEEVKTIVTTVTWPSRSQL